MQTLMMTSAQVVETSVNVTNNSPSRDYSHPDDQTTQTTETPGFKPFTVFIKIMFCSSTVAFLMTFCCLVFHSVKACKLGVTDCFFFLLMSKLQNDYGSHFHSYIGKSQVYLRYLGQGQIIL